MDGMVNMRGSDGTVRTQSGPFGERDDTSEAQKEMEQNRVVRRPPRCPRESLEKVVHTARDSDQRRGVRQPHATSRELVFMMTIYERMFDLPHGR